MLAEASGAKEVWSAALRFSLELAAFGSRAIFRPADEECVHSAARNYRRTIVIAALNINIIEEESAFERARVPEFGGARAHAHVQEAHAQTQERATQRSEGDRRALFEIGENCVVAPLCCRATQRPAPKAAPAAAAAAATTATCKIAPI